LLCSIVQVALDPTALGVGGRDHAGAGLLERVDTRGELLAAEPWRTFRWYMGQQHFSGTYWSATERAHVIYESRLELARLLYADFDPGVSRIVAQPFLLTVHIDGKDRRHIPDFLLLTEAGPVVVDVKPARRLSNPDVVFTFGWSRAVVESRGWGYQVWSEPATAELENVRFLAGYRCDWLFDPQILDALGRANLGGATLAEAFAAAPGFDAKLVRASVFHLLWSGRLATNYGPGAVRLGVGARMLYDGEAVEVVETVATMAGNEVVLKDRLGGLRRVAVRELLFSDRCQIIADGPGPSSTDDKDLASVVLSRLGIEERRRLLEKAEHVGEVRFGYKSGSAELARAGKPRPGYDPGLPHKVRYQTKADELGLSMRTIERWVAEAATDGEAGLAAKSHASTVLDRCDLRWVETALEVMVEHVDQAKPLQKAVLDRTRARVIARFGEGAVEIPAKTKAYEALAQLERQHPTFRLSAKRNRDIAGRPREAFGQRRGRGRCRGGDDRGAFLPALAGQGQDPVAGGPLRLSTMVTPVDNRNRVEELLRESEVVICPYL